MKKLLRKKLRPKLKAKTGSKTRSKVGTRTLLKSKVKSKVGSMRDDQLDRLTVPELKELATQVDKAIAGRLNAERAELREKFRTMAEEAGLTLADITGGGRGGKSRDGAAKFANPANPSETWSGRGRQPKWLSARLKSGADRDDFRV